MMMIMKAVTILFPEKYIEAIENLVKRGYFPNKSEGFRMAVSNFVHNLVPAFEAMFLKDVDSNDKEIKDTKKTTKGGAAGVSA